MSRRIVHTESDLYPHSVTFIIGDRPADNELGAMAKRWGLWNGQGSLPSVGGGLGGTCAFSSGAVVWISAPLGHKDFWPIYVHEMVHVLNSLGDQIGERQTFKNDELFAYYAGWLTRKLLRS